MHSQELIENPELAGGDRRVWLAALRHESTQDAPTVKELYDRYEAGSVTVQEGFVGITVYLFGM